MSVTIDESTRTELQKKFSSIVLVISPPRCGSTVFSRVIWNHPSIAYYSHEPFEKAYYAQSSIADAFQQLLNPLSFQALQEKTAERKEHGLVLKEIAFQSKAIFPDLAALTQLPVIFLIRDPRLSIYSKISKKEKIGQSPIFPVYETGWTALSEQINYCEAAKVPYMIVDANDFRTHPQSIFKQVFEKLKLPFSENLLTWQAAPTLQLDNFGGSQGIYFERVLNSTGIQPATEEIPTMEMFPTQGGIRAHVEACMEMYYGLKQNEFLLQAELETL